MYRYLIGCRSDFPEDNLYENFRVVISTRSKTYVCERYDINLAQRIIILSHDFRTSDNVREWFNSLDDSIISRDIGAHRVEVLREIWGLKIK